MSASEPFTVSSLSDRIAALTDKQRRLFDAVWNYFVEKSAPFPCRAAPVVLAKLPLRQALAGLHGGLILESDEQGSRVLQLTLHGALLTGHHNVLVGLLINLLDYVRTLYQQDHFIKEITSGQIVEAMRLSSAEERMLFALLRICYLPEMPIRLGGWQANGTAWVLAVTEEITELFCADSVAEFFDGRLSSGYSEGQACLIEDRYKPLSQSMGTLSEQEIAMELLRAYNAHAKATQEPAFARDLGAQFQLDSSSSERAYQYLADRGWLKTFSLPFAARINASGLDALRTAELQTETLNPKALGFAGSTAEIDEPRRWDVFISHASEDKAHVAEPLEQLLTARGLKVWLDCRELTLGDSLRQSIDEGLAKSRFGVVVLSPSFFRKQWPKSELDGLFAREISGEKVILPVWHQMDEPEIRQHSPLLAGRLAVRTDQGLEYVVDQIIVAVRRDSKQPIAQLEAEPAPAPRKPADCSALVEFTNSLSSERAAAIAAKEGAIQIMDDGALVLHVVPYAAIRKTPAPRFNEIAESPHRFLPMKGNAHGVRVNYDGLVIGSNSKGLEEAQRAFVKIGRTGALESVISSLAGGRATKHIPMPYLQALIVRYACDYIAALGSFGIEAPFGVHAAIVNAKGIRLLRDFAPQGGFPEDAPFEMIDRDVLPFGPCIVEETAERVGDVALALKPLLDHLAQATGLSSAPYFDSDGRFLMNLMQLQGRLVLEEP